MAEKSWLDWRLENAGIRRRDFVKFCAATAAYFALPRGAAAEMARAIAKTQKPVVVWLEFQDCTADSESFLRAHKPSAAEVLLDVLSLDYHETLMAAAGHQAEAARDAVVKNYAGQYIAIVEGSIPTGEGEYFCTIGGKSAYEIAREVCGNAAATIAVGTCAAFGGLPAAAPNPTHALGVQDALPKLKNLINLPACPANAENLCALIVYYLTYKRWPELDRHRRPLFAHGKTIHDACERRAHFDAAQYVEQWGDEGHRAGYCLYKVGCKGPVAYHNCPEVRWNEGTNWPIGAGHPCIGCSEPDFWDKMTPFYRHLPGIPGFETAAGIDTVGKWAVAGVGAAMTAETLIQLGKRKLKPPKEAAEQAAPAGNKNGGLR